MRWNRLFAVAVLTLSLLGFGSVAISQEADTETEAAEPAADPAAESTDDSAGQVEEKKKRPFSLYVEVGAGSASEDRLDLSMITLSTRDTGTSLALQDQFYGRAAVGWKLQKDKGDFRLLFNGYKEDGYAFAAEGRENAVDPSLLVTAPVADNLVWWNLSMVNGSLYAERTPPQWDRDLDDANEDGMVNADEVRYIGADLTSTRTVADDLQNRVQTYDFLYGRKFGRRRYSARWWAGLRYFIYQGNLPSAAWLSTSPVGSGFTDGSSLRLINVSQDTTGFGPTGALEAQFNLLNDEKLTLFIGAQAAFLIQSMDIDTGEFLTHVTADVGSIGTVIIPASAHLEDSRTKSTWQAMGELGARFRLKNGLRFEAAYTINGYLDAILMPHTIIIPENQQEAPFGSSALYDTQNYVLDGWRIGAAFQF